MAPSLQMIKIVVFIKHKQAYIMHKSIIILNKSAIVWNEFVVTWTGCTGFCYDILFAIYFFGQMHNYLG